MPKIIAPMTVNMPVICLGKECKKCYDLEIEVIKTQSSYGFDGMECINTIRCKNVNKCKRIARMINMANNEENV